jgi:peptidyl-prolyl cis-trans isomerase C
MIKVNGKPIPQSAIDYELGRLVQFYSQYLSEDQVRQQINALRDRAKEQAIGARLLFDEAERLQIEVSEAELDARIAQYEEQCGGKEAFAALLKKQNINPVEFREQTRRGRRVDKLVEMHTAGIPDPTEEEMREHFENHRDEYTKDAQAQAQHILVSPKGSGEDAKAEALSKILDLKRRIEAGEDFSALAAAHSDCPSGKQAGGSLGWFGRGAMVPEFDKAVFSMEDGEVSDVVETQFGYHIIRKVAHIDAESPTFEEAREKIRDFLRHAARGEALKAYVSELREKAVIEE